MESSEPNGTQSHIKCDQEVTNKLKIEEDIKILEESSVCKEESETSDQRPISKRQIASHSLNDVKSNPDNDENTQLSIPRGTRSTRCFRTRSVQSLGNEVANTTDSLHVPDTLTMQSCLNVIEDLLQDPEVSKIVNGGWQFGSSCLCLLDIYKKRARDDIQGKRSTSVEYMVQSLNKVSELLQGGGMKSDDPEHRKLACQYKVKFRTACTANGVPCLSTATSKGAGPPRQRQQSSPTDKPCTSTGGPTTTNGGANGGGRTGPRWHPVASESNSVPQNNATADADDGTPDQRQKKQQHKPQDKGCQENGAAAKPKKPEESTGNAAASTPQDLDQQITDFLKSGNHAHEGDVQLDTMSTQDKHELLARLKARSAGPAEQPETSSWYRNKPKRSCVQAAGKRGYAKYDSGQTNSESGDGDRSSGRKKGTSPRTPAAKSTATQSPSLSNRRPKRKRQAHAKYMPGNEGMPAHQPLTLSPSAPPGLRPGLSGALQGGPEMMPRLNHDVARDGYPQLAPKIGGVSAMDGGGPGLGGFGDLFDLHDTGSMDKLLAQRLGLGQQGLGGGDAARREGVLAGGLDGMGGLDALGEKDMAAIGSLGGSNSNFVQRFIGCSGLMQQRMLREQLIVRKRLMMNAWMLFLERKHQYERGKSIYEILLQIKYKKENWGLGVANGAHPPGMLGQLNAAREAGEFPGHSSGLIRGGQGLLAEAGALLGCNSVPSLPPNDQADRLVPGGSLPQLPQSYTLPSNINYLPDILANMELPKGGPELPQHHSMPHPTSQSIGRALNGAGSLNADRFGSVNRSGSVPDLTSPTARAGARGASYAHGYGLASHGMGLLPGGHDDFGGENGRDGDRRGGRGHGPGALGLGAVPHGSDQQGDGLLGDVDPLSLLDDPHGGPAHDDFGGQVEYMQQYNGLHGADLDTMDAAFRGEGGQLHGALHEDAHNVARPESASLLKDLGLDGGIHGNKEQSLVHDLAFVQ